MNRRQKIVAASIAGALAALVLVAWVAQRRARLAKNLPAGMDYPQPPDQVIGVPPAASWAACRPPAMGECSTANSAGWRHMRLYDPSLEQSQNSIIRANLHLGGSVN